MELFPPVPPLPLPNPLPLVSIFSPRPHPAPLSFPHIMFLAWGPSPLEHTKLLPANRCLHLLFTLPERPISVFFSSFISYFHNYLPRNTSRISTPESVPYLRRYSPLHHPKTFLESTYNHQAIFWVYLFTFSPLLLQECKFHKGGTLSTFCSLKYPVASTL